MWICAALGHADLGLDAARPETTPASGLCQKKIPTSNNSLHAGNTSQHAGRNSLSKCPRSGIRLKTPQRSSDDLTDPLEGSDDPKRRSPLCSRSNLLTASQAG